MTRKLAIDLGYVANHSFTGDLAILLYTVVAVLRLSRSIPADGLSQPRSWS